MSVKVYGCNHVAIEVDDIEAAVAFYKDVFNLEQLDRGEGDAFFKLGEHQFLAIFKVDEVKPDRMRHFTKARALPSRIQRTFPFGNHAQMLSHLVAKRAKIRAAVPRLVLNR